MTKPPFVIHRDDQPFPTEMEVEYQDWGARLTSQVDAVPWEWGIAVICALGVLFGLAV